ncbi:MAG TPA: hypothetical protein VMW75_11300 [Thermoanaerobaculia bacterium]|nr:hypothetical protein [Thermoanaerobaculia bacterium]
MLNLAGREYDFGPVLFTVLQDCEHRRRSLPADDADVAASLSAIARQKLNEIKPCHDEAGGTPAYWHELEGEVLDTALPQYARAAAAQTRLELAGYGLWRQGDPLSRLALGLAGLTVGGLIVKAPFIPIFEDAFAFVLAAAAFFYPEIKRLVYDWRYSRLLNRLIAQAEKYQHRQLPYVSEAGLEAELRAVGATAGSAQVTTTGSAPATAAGSVPATTTGSVPGAAAGAQAAASTQPAGPRRTALVAAPLSIFAPSETAPPPALPPDASRPRATAATEPAEPPAGPRPKAAERR